MTDEGGELILVRPEPVHLTSDDDPLESREDSNNDLIALISLPPSVR